MSRGRMIQGVSRNCVLVGAQEQNMKMRFHTTISRLPIIAARCSEVLLLSSKFGFSRNLGLFFMIRFTSKTSFHRIALRKRTCTGRSTLVVKFSTSPRKDTLGKSVALQLRSVHHLLGHRQVATVKVAGLPCSLREFQEVERLWEGWSGPWNGVQMAAEKLTRGRKGNQNVVQESRVTLEHGFQKVERGDKS